MENTQILSIGRDPVLLQKLSRFMNANPGWESTATIDDETAIKLYDMKNYDLVILFNNLEKESVNKLSSDFLSKNPGLIIIADVGDSTVILEDKINKALQLKENLKEQSSSDQ